MQFPEFDLFRETMCPNQLNLYNKEVLTRHAITIWINRTLKHLELSLGANFDSILFQERSVFELRANHVLHVHKVRDLTVLNQELLFLQLLEMVGHPLLQAVCDINIVLFMRRCVQK